MKNKKNKMEENKKKYKRSDILHYAVVIGKLTY